MFWAAELTTVTRWTRASSRWPTWPRGSLMPSCWSTLNSWGNTCRISRSVGRVMALACSSTRRISSSPISEVLGTRDSPRLTVITPALFMLRTCSPDRATYTPSIFTSAWFSASLTAASIEAMVSLTLTTIPLRIPVAGVRPTPSRFMRPSSSTWAITAQTLVVPTSRPEIIPDCSS